MKALISCALAAAFCSFCLPTNDNSDWIVTTATKTDGPIGGKYYSCKNMLVVRYESGGSYSVRYQIKNSVGNYSYGGTATKLVNDQTTYEFYDSPSTCTYQFLDLN